MLIDVAPTQEVVFNYEGLAPEEMQAMFTRHFQAEVLRSVQKAYPKRFINHITQGGERTLLGVTFTAPSGIVSEVEYIAWSDSDAFCDIVPLENDEELKQVQQQYAGTVIEMVKKKMERGDIL